MKIASAPPVRVDPQNSPWMGEGTSIDTLGSAPNPDPPHGRADFVDVSHYESKPDWDAYQKSGRNAAILKATETTTYTDPTLVSNRAALDQRGLYCGLYHFAGSSVHKRIGDPIAEAHHFIDEVGQLGPKEFPVLDFELSYKMKPSQQVKWIATWCAEVEKQTGKIPWVYTGESMLSQMDASSLTRYPLWVARYPKVVDPNNPPASGSWPSLVAWQYTPKANIAGIGICDDSYLYGSFESILNRTKPTPQVKER